jgi:hypothetical protein
MNLAHTFNKLLRRKRSDSATAGTRETEAPVARDDYDSSMDVPTAATRPSLNKPKLSRILAAAYSLDALFRNATEKKKVPGGATRLAGCGRGLPLLCSVHGRLGGLRAVPLRCQGAIQSADVAVVADLTKRRFLKDTAGEARATAAVGNTTSPRTLRSSGIC